jgi:hypothetical protein
MASVPEEAVEDLKPKQAPAFVTKPEPFTVTEGEMARFCCRVTGHPKPRVMWVVNGHTVVNVRDLAYVQCVVGCAPMAAVCS